MAEGKNERFGRIDVRMKRRVLGGGWEEPRLKAVRYHVIQVGGRLVQHGREPLLRAERTVWERLNEWRLRLRELAALPSR